MSRYFTNIRRLQKAIYWGAGGLFCASCSPHLFPSLIERGFKAEGVATPPELQAHVEKVAAGMHLARPKNISVFITSGFSSINGGNTLLPGGAVIGLPRSVLFQNERDVREVGITFIGQPVDWDSKEAHDLVEIVKPSSKQINFSIAHEVAHIQYLDFVLQAMLLSASLLASCWLARLTHLVTNPHSHDALVLVAFIIGLVSYCYARPALSHWQEFRADRRAALSHKSYCRGGEEMMSKRIALEELTSSWTGNNKQDSSSSNTHPSFQDRLSRLQKLHYAARA